MTVQTAVLAVIKATKTRHEDLAKVFGVHQTAFSGRLQTFKFHQREIKNMVESMGYKYQSMFARPDGTAINISDCTSMELVIKNICSDTGVRFARVSEFLGYNQATFLQRCRVGKIDEETLSRIGYCVGYRYKWQIIKPDGKKLTDSDIDEINRKKTSLDHTRKYQKEKCYLCSITINDKKDMDILQAIEELQKDGETFVGAIKKLISLGVNSLK